MKKTDTILIISLLAMIVTSYIYSTLPSRGASDFIKNSKMLSYTENYRKNLEKFLVENDKPSFNFPDIKDVYFTDQYSMVYYYVSDADNLIVIIPVISISEENKSIIVKWECYGMPYEHIPITDFCTNTQRTRAVTGRINRPTIYYRKE